MNLDLSFLEAQFSREQSRPLPVNVYEITGIRIRLDLLIGKLN